MPAIPPAVNLAQFDTLMVPQGAEYKAVCRGLKKVKGVTPQVLALPVGSSPVQKYLQQLDFVPARVLLLGLCGSLQAELGIGDIVVYESCLNFKTQSLKLCDVKLTQMLAESLGEKAARVTGLMCDRVISTAAQKRAIARDYKAEVVDMEGFAVLDALSAIGASVAMLRVVSDDCYGDIPDLSTAISTDGKLKPLSLTFSFLKQPLAAQRLIRGSLKGLNVLENLFLTGK